MPFLQLSYWLDIAPFPLYGWKFWFGVVVLILLLAAAFVFYFSSKRCLKETTKRLFERLATATSTIGFLWVLLLFFRQERAPYASARILPALLFVGLLVWIILILFYIFKKLPRSLAREYHRREFHKYFPKRKKM